MIIIQDKGITFDDVSIVPQHSDLKSRSEVDLSIKIGHFNLKVPILSSPMSTITESKMAYAMYKAGGLGILHRYMEIDENLFYSFWNDGVPFIPSIGIKGHDILRAQEYRHWFNKANILSSICVDIANGDNLYVHKIIKYLKNELKYDTIISGNVATASGALRLADAGANVIRSGLGSGSVCTTRVMTGIGVPQLTAVQWCSEAINNSRFKDKVQIISDGGVRQPQDFVKALVFGADTIMIGNMLAGTPECPGEVKDGKKRFSGMASFVVQMEHNGKVNNYTPEGESMYVPVKPPVNDIIKYIAGGMRSGFSYLGARNIKELRENAEVMFISNSALIENGPHALYK